MGGKTGSKFGANSEQIKNLIYSLAEWVGRLFVPDMCMQMPLFCRWTSDHFSLWPTLHGAFTRRPRKETVISLRPCHPWTLASEVLSITSSAARLRQHLLNSSRKALLKCLAYLGTYPAYTAMTSVRYIKSEVPELPVNGDVEPGNTEATIVREGMSPSTLTAVCLDIDPRRY